MIAHKHSAVIAPIPNQTRFFVDSFISEKRTISNFCFSSEIDDSKELISSKID